MTFDVVAEYNRLWDSHAMTAERPTHSALRDLERIIRADAISVRTEAPHKPIAWIATHERGTVNHYSIADGWKVEAVQSVVSPLERK